MKTSLTQKETYDYLNNRLYSIINTEPYKIGMDTDENDYNIDLFFLYNPYSDTNYGVGIFTFDEYSVNDGPYQPVCYFEVIQKNNKVSIIIDNEEEIEYSISEESDIENLIKQVASNDDKIFLKSYYRQVKIDELLERV